MLHRLAPESNFAPVPASCRTWIEVDRAALVANARTVLGRCPAGTRILPMVKADGYGVGAVEVARALELVDPWGFGVASTDEGRQLRDAGVKRRILVLAPLEAELGQLAKQDLTPALSSSAMIEAWFRVAGSERPFHVQVDTGMCRAGIWWEDMATLERAFAPARGFEGVFTHFHSAESDAASVMLQASRFKVALDKLSRRPPLVHAANSAAALLYPELTAFDMVRPGIFLYGGRAGTDAPAPRAVVSWRARVVEVNARPKGVSVSYGATWKAETPVTIATIAAGYADGLRRTLSSRADIVISGRRHKVAGRVTMDLTALAADGPVATGDVATLIGRDGGQEITVDEMAECAGTISYEILTGLSERVARVYG